MNNKIQTLAAKIIEDIAKEMDDQINEMTNDILKELDENNDIFGLIEDINNNDLKKEIKKLDETERTKLIKALYNTLLDTMKANMNIKLKERMNE